MPLRLGLYQHSLFEDWIEFVKVCVRARVCVHLHSSLWGNLDVELVIILWNRSWLSNLVFKMPSYYARVVGRKRESERRSGWKEKNCHSKFIYIPAPRCVRPIIPTRSTYRFVCILLKRITYSLCRHALFQDYPLWQHKENFEKCCWTPVAVITIHIVSDLSKV